VSAQIERVAREVMRYFIDGTAAADTLEGISRWRLMQQRIDHTVDETAAALRLLTARGFVEEVRTVGPTLFRLNASKRAEITAALNDRSEV
jgi:hypothetical protein